MTDKMQILKNDLESLNPKFMAVNDGNETLFISSNVDDVVEYISNDCGTFWIDIVSEESNGKVDEGIVFTVPDEPE